MKHLFLIRHAKSSWADEDLGDRERPLNARGEKQLAPLGKALTHNGGFDAVVYASNAERAKQTLAGVLPATFPAERAHVSPELYTFDYQQLVHWLQKRENDEQIALIGHNPALLELAQWLLKHPPAHLPTASFIHIHIPVDHWYELKKGKGRLDRFLTPKDFSYPDFARKLKKRAETSGNNPAKDVPAALRHQLTVIKQLEPGVILGLDNEFLHHYRIAIRRSRAIAESIQEVTRDNLLSRAIKQLKRHAKATGRLRDLHVLLEDVPRLCQGNEELRTTLHTYFENEAEEEHARLLNKLNGKHYHDSMNDWQHLIDSRKFHKLAGKLTPKDIRKVVEQRIKQFNRRTAELMVTSPDEDIHRLRKLLKRIRYLMELDKAGWKGSLETLKGRQKLYGGFQDLRVQIELMEQFRNNAPKALPAAISGLEDVLKQQKADVRKQILALGGLDGAQL